MADCGASGSALDQAARSFLGSANANNGETQKHFGKLFGHAAVTGASMHNAMPMARPDHVAMPNGASSGDALLAMDPQIQRQQQNYRPGAVASASNPLDAAWQASRHPAVASQHPHYQHHPMQHHMAMQQQQQHHHHHQMMMMQQQQMMMMQAQRQQQQQQLNNRQTELSQAKQSLETEKADQKQAAISDLDEWHEGLADEIQSVLGNEGDVRGASIEELAAAWTEAQADKANALSEEIGHEGNVNGASMEQLAAAWTEAQNEYYQQLDEDPSTWWAESEPAESHPLPYQFTHKTDFAETTIPKDTNFMEKGMQNFTEGNLSEAIQNFEMELQVNDPDNAVAWRMLGRCHAENDQDREAITCLEHAVDRDPYSPEALLALGVSYVNELNHTKALANLKQWITNNPKYAGMDLDVGDDVYGDASADANDSGFQEVQDLLLKALEFDSSDAADVWEALGVAANVSRDYETAVEAFNKAIEARPDDYQLWNKLGATLANSSQSDKALPAYHKALQLKPKYARAWLNMAISHSNLQDFDEAARCYLQTLSLNPAAVHCWSYLRVALSCSERWDLIPLAASQDLNAFKEHFDFVMYD